MADIKFPCPKCGNHFIADTCQQGQEFECTHCMFKSKVPNSQKSTHRMQYKFIVRWSIIALLVIMVFVLTVYGYKQYTNRYMREAYGYLKIADKKSAINALEKHLVIHPDDLLGRWSLAGMLSEEGDNKRACQLYYSIIMSKPRWSNDNRFSLLLHWQWAIDAKLSSTKKEAKELSEKKEYPASAARYSDILQIYRNDVVLWLQEQKLNTEDEMKTLKKEVAVDVAENRANWVLSHYSKYNEAFWLVYAQSIFAKWQASPDSIYEVLRNGTNSWMSGLYYQPDSSSFIEKTASWKIYTTSMRSTMNWLEELACIFRSHAQELEKTTCFKEASDVYKLSALVFDTFSATAMNNDSNVYAYALSDSCGAMIGRVRCLCKGPNSNFAEGAYIELSSKIKERGIVLKESETRDMIGLCSLLADRAFDAGNTNLARMRMQYATELVNSLK